MIHDIIYDIIHENKITNNNEQYRIQKVLNIKIRL